MFTGSAVRVQAVQDLKLQEEQEIGRRSWKSGRQHPQSLAEARRREGREQEVEAGGREQEEGKGRRTAGGITPKSQKPRFTSFLSLSSSLFSFFPTLLPPSFSHFSFVCPFISISHSFTLTSFSFFSCTPLFYPSLLLYRCLKLFIYYSHNFISLFLFDGEFEPRTLQDNTPHYQSDGPHFESSKLYAPTQTLEDPF